MRWTPAVLILLLLMFGFAAGCMSSDERKILGETRVTLLSTANEATVATKLKHALTLELPAPAEGGHVWELVAADARFLQQTTEVVSVAGGSGNSQISFLTLRTGRTRLRFLAVPPVPAPTVKPTDVYDVIVTID